MTYNKNYLIYQIKSWNGKVYIGQTTEKSLLKRINDHKNCRSDCYIHRAIRKHGWDNFQFSIIERGLSVDEVDERERYWIASGDYTNPKHGYNRESGGNLNKSHSQETKDKMSKSHQGKTFSDDFKRKVSENHVGMKGKSHKKESKIKSAETKLGIPITAFYIRIQLCFRAGWSISKISRLFKHSRKTISKYRNYGSV